MYTHEFNVNFEQGLPHFLRHESFFARCGPQRMYRPGGVGFSDLGAAQVDAREAGFLFF